MAKDLSLEAMNEILAVCLSRLRSLLRKKAAQGYVVPRKIKGRRITFGPSRPHVSYNDRSVTDRSNELDQRCRGGEEAARRR